jgi:hypothetical protein
MSSRTQSAPRAEVRHLAPGQKIPTGGRGPEEAGARGLAPGAVEPALQPGDFILTHGDAWTSQLIRFGQGLRFRGPDQPYTYWNHAAIIVDADGSIVEALGSGVQKRNIAVYEPTQRTLVQITASDIDRQQACAFANWSVGAPYGFFTIASIAYALLTGGKFSFGFDGQQICSGLVARALERTGLIFAHDPAHIMPAELAKLYNVSPPPANMPKGRIPPKSAR